MVVFSGSGVVLGFGLGLLGGLAGFHISNNSFHLEADFFSLLSILVLRRRLEGRSHHILLDTGV
jgi:hypothetical protein